MTRPWSNIGTAQCLIILDICAVICKSHQGFKRYKADTKYSHTMFNLRLWPWPWSNLGTAHRLIILDIYALFVNPTRGSKDIERTPNTVIQCLILNCYLDLDPTLVKHRHCTSSYHTWHLCKVICKSHQGFKRYKADTKYSHTMLNLRLWPWPWSNLGTAHRLIILDICAVICKSHQGFKR